MDHVLVALCLAGDARADARKHLTSLFRDRLAAIIAFLRTLAARCEGAGTKDRIFHSVVDLVLNRAVARPTTGHFPSSRIGHRGRRRRDNRAALSLPRSSRLAPNDALRLGRCDIGTKRSTWNR